MLRDWLEMHAESLTYEELAEFDMQVLDLENPSMQRYLLNGEPLLPEHDNKYMNILVDYVEARKDDYAGNVPRSRII